MFNVDDKVYKALQGIQYTGKDIPVRHVRNLDGGQYPSIVFSEISNVPALNADNVEIKTRSTVQVSIIYTGMNANNIAEEVEKRMLASGFLRQSMNDMSDADSQYIIFRFTIYNFD